MASIVLNGITWGHSRGITPLLAVSQRYSELNPGVEIKWKKRTLQEFADFSIEELTKDYDLVVIGVGEEWGLESQMFGFRPQRIAQDCPTSLLIVRKHQR